MPFETLHVLPESGSRFGTIMLGFDRVTTLRDEHMALCDVAALLVSVPPDRMSLVDVRNMAMTLAHRSALPETEQIEGALAAVEKLMTADVSSDRPRLAADAALWILAVGRSPTA